MRYLSLLILWCLSTSTLADSPARATEKIFTSPNQRYFFTMVPQDSGYSDEHPGATGKAYRLQADGDFTLLWRVSGWYAHQLYLSNDGVHLVRIGNWATGCELSDKQLAVAFYKQGDLLKKYSTRDLIKQENSIRCSVSHYQWRAETEQPQWLGYDNDFYLTTIEGVEYRFSLTTGDILSQTSISEKQ